jgi:hypothetical protein
MIRVCKIRDTSSSPAKLAKTAAHKLAKTAWSEPLFLARDISLLCHFVVLSLRDRGNLSSSFAGNTSNFTELLMVYRANICLSTMWYQSCKNKTSRQSRPETTPSRQIKAFEPLLQKLPRTCLSAAFIGPQIIQDGSQCCHDSIIHLRCDTHSILGFVSKGL